MSYQPVNQPPQQAYPPPPQYYPSNQPPPPGQPGMMAPPPQYMNQPPPPAYPSHQPPPPGYPSQPGMAPPPPSGMYGTQDKPLPPPPMGHMPVDQTPIAQPVILSGSGALGGCPHCGAGGNVIPRKVPGSMVWICCIVLFCVFWPLMCVPFCIPGCYDTIYTCGNCGKFLYRKNAL